MKTIKTVFLAIAVVLLAGVLAPPAHAQVSFDLAYSNLSQNGSWLVSAQYGHVWQPREYNRDWNPYYDGHWVYTDMGWAWVSDYTWGSLPYHYGTWVADPNVGWVWIPGNVWAPSWVVFRTGSDYIGWAPVPPGFSVGMSIDFGGPSSFVYVSSRDFLAPRLRASIIPMERTSVFVNNTTVVNNIVVQNNVVVNRGPDYRTVERATGHSITQQRIESVARVAPFAHVDRAELAVAPERVKRGVRVAEPVPASRLLPVSGQRAIGQQNSSPTDASKSPNAHSAARPNAKEHSTAPAAITPDSTAETKKKANANAKAEQNAKAQANQHAKAQADQTTEAQANQHAKAQADQSSKTQANAKANADQHAKAQTNSKAQADAKAKADAKGKKDNPDKKDPGSEKPTAPEPKGGNQQ